jgi:hypothetical protein
LSNVYCDRCLDLVKEHRSKKSHDHFHAHLDEAWKQLPHGISELYPSVDHLRKRALIDAGYYDEEIIDCGTNEAAIRVASCWSSSMIGS